MAKKINQRSLSRLLIIYVILFSSAITFIATGFQLYREYEQNIDVVDSNIRQLEISILPGIKEAVWNIDTIQLQILLNGIVAMQDIKYVEIRSENRLLASSGVERESFTVRQKFELEFDFFGKKTAIGTLFLNVDMDAIFARIIDRAALILLSNGIKTFFVALFISAIFSYLVTRHLNKLATFARHLSLDEEIDELKLNRSASPPNRLDELDYLVSALNEMRENIVNSHRALRDSHDDMEFQIVEGSAKLANSESELAEAQSIAHLGSWSRNIATGQSDWSDEQFRIFGLSPSDPQPNYDQFLKFVHPDDRNDVEAEYIAAIDQDRDYNIEYRIVRPNGDVRYIQSRCIFTRNALGDPETMIGTVLDITDLKNSEYHLHHAQRMEAVGQLTAGIAHDFNNMLAGIQGNIDLLCDGFLSEKEQSERLGRATAIVKRGALLTNHLLAFSRKQALRPKPTLVHELTSNLLSLMRSTLSESITISMNFEVDLWSAVIDPNQLENAILNLVINARDAMPKGGNVHIHGENITIDRRASDAFLDLETGDYIALSIRDTGLGIEQDQIDKVFEPFFTTKDVSKGSGMGLSMVHGFVNQSGGHVAIKSEVGVGTEITLYLPRALEKAEEEHGDAIGPHKSPKGNGERVMVVEDDQDVRESTIALLKRLGYKIVDGGDGNRIENIFQNQSAPIDLLLSDIILPNGNSGPKIAELVSLRDPTTKILFMTGYAEQELIKSTTDHQKHPIINKPFSSTELANQVYDTLASG